MALCRASRAALPLPAFSILVSKSLHDALRRRDVYFPAVAFWVWSSQPWKHSYKLFPELHQATSWHLVVFNFSTIGTVHSPPAQFCIQRSGRVLMEGQSRLSPMVSVWRHVMIHMGCVWSEKAQSLLILPLFCHLGRKRQCVELISSLSPSAGGPCCFGLTFPKHLRGCLGIIENMFL